MDRLLMAQRWQLAALRAPLPWQGNAEETFSLSGRLSNDNTKTQPGFLATLVRINKNRPLHNPPWNAILAAYKRKYHKLPTMGDDVTDDEGSQADSDESDGAMSD